MNINGGIKTMKIKSSIEVLTAIENKEGLLEVLDFLKETLKVNMAGLSMDIGISRQTLFGYMKGNPIPAEKEEIMWQVLRQKFINDAVMNEIMSAETYEEERTNSDKVRAKEMYQIYAKTLQEATKVYAKTKNPQSLQYMQFCKEEVDFWKERM